MTKSAISKKPHPIDVHAGTRLKTRRMLLGMSQEQLGNAIGLTFQQIQKYENGTNRFGMSRAYELAVVLDVDPGYFFEEISSSTVSTIRNTIRTRQKKADIENIVDDSVRNKISSLEADATRISNAYLTLPTDSARELVKEFFKFIAECEKRKS